MSIQVDLKHLNGFVQSQEMEGIAPQVKMAHHMLHNGTGKMCIRDRYAPVA